VRAAPHPAARFPPRRTRALREGMR
jgi:hypothetical protein